MGTEWSELRASHLFHGMPRVLPVWKREGGKTTPQEATACRVLWSQFLLFGLSGWGWRSALTGEGELGRQKGALFAFPVQDETGNSRRELQALFMLMKCQGEAGKGNTGMGWVQIGSTQGQGEETQRSLRRQLGVEKGLGFYLLMVTEFFYQVFQLFTL